MICEIHKKDMKQNARGWYCSTPIEKSADGKVVLKWCDWKPAKVASPERQQLEGQVLASIVSKLDKLQEGMNTILGDLAQRP